jgi:hypothetical protein
MPHVTHSFDSHKQFQVDDDGHDNLQGLVKGTQVLQQQQQQQLSIDVRERKVSPSSTLPLSIFMVISWQTTHLGVDVLQLVAAAVLR